MPLQSLEVLTARAGSYILNDTSTVTGNVYAVVVLEDTVFDTLTDSGGLTKGSYIAAVGTAVKAGAIITPLDINKPFATVKLTSGSVALVKG
jgi:hypothetical protein